MSSSEERGRLAKDHNLKHQQQVELAKTLKEKGYSNSAIANIMRTSENVVRVLLTPLISKEQTIWFPGAYEGRTDEKYTQIATHVNFDVLVQLVQTRAQEDGEWAIRNHLVGDNEDKMRRFMAFVSDEKNIRQCVEHIRKEGRDHEVTVDWVCRDLANASKWMIR